ncbi:DUF4232 domain-containing protein [Streptomyces sp. NPDC048483]|uniref:DUF4232 domain-containing protein n=1 Tax=Streptomyces sp. NPDC048483 TaxID=3154927 RepID=UPI003438E074
MPRSDADLRARSARRRTLRIAAAGLTAVTALALTSCGSQDDADALRTRPAKPFHPLFRDTRYPTDEHRIGEGGPGVRARPAACDAAAIRIVATPLTRPVDHLLLEATNTSGSPCSLYAAPYLRFDDAQSPLAGLPYSKPQAVVTLTPGTSGYAAVRTSSADGSKRHGHKVTSHKATSLRVSLPGRNGQGGFGGTAKVALPGGSLYPDESAWVTYWQSDPGNAAAW